MGGVEGVDSGAKDRLVEVIGCWPCSPSQRGNGRAWKRREKRERGSKEGRVRCQAGERNRPLEISLSFVFYFNSCTSAPLVRMDRTLALIRCCYNEIEMNLANTRLRFKCLETVTHTNIYIERRLKVNVWRNEAEMGSSFISIERAVQLLESESFCQRKTFTLM